MITRRFVAVCAAVPLLLTTAGFAAAPEDPVAAKPPTAACPNGTFGSMYESPPSPADGTAEDIEALAGSMLDPNADPGTDLAKDSWTTYFGQFLDHTATKDLTPQPAAGDTLDPEAICNARTSELDLDSLFCPGGAPAGMMRPDGRFAVAVNANGVLDLPRGPSAFDPHTGQPGQPALLCEGRNDENAIISQIHLAFMLAYNRLLDEGMAPKKAQAELGDWFQAIALYDFLPDVVDETVIADLRDGDLPRFANRKLNVTPIEWSVGAYRFGHSAVRLAYRVQPTAGVTPPCANRQVFNAAGNDLHGGRATPANNRVVWAHLDRRILPRPADPACEMHPRRIDTMLSAGLFNLPFSATGGGTNELSQRNLVRGQAMGLPSLQQLQAELGVPVTPGTAILPNLLDDDGQRVDAFDQHTPLWYGCLWEAQTEENGERLGTVCGRTVADYVVSTLERKDGILKNGTERRPDLRGFTFADLVRFARVA